MRQTAQPQVEQANLFEKVEAEWVEVDLKRVRVACVRQFGGLGYELLQRLELIQFLAEQLGIGRGDIPWATMSMVLVLARWCDPSSELHLAEQGYESMALADLLGVPADKVNDDRLYRAPWIISCRTKMPWRNISSSAWANYSRSNTICRCTT